MQETWYVMEDGSAGDPREIKRGADGKLAHADGRKVAYAPHGPRARTVDVDAERKKAAPKSTAGKPATKATEARDLKAEEPKAAYKTRESKAG